MKRKREKTSMKERKNWSLLKETAIANCKSVFAREMAERVNVENMTQADIEMLVLMAKQ